MQLYGAFCEVLLMISWMLHQLLEKLMPHDDRLVKLIYVHESYLYQIYFIVYLLLFVTQDATNLTVLNLPLPSYHKGKKRNLLYNFFYNNKYYIHV